MVEMAVHHQDCYPVEFVDRIVDLPVVKIGSSNVLEHFLEVSLICQSPGHLDYLVE